MKPNKVVLYGSLLQQVSSLSLLTLFLLAHSDGGKAYARSKTETHGQAWPWGGVSLDSSKNKLGETLT